MIGHGRPTALRAGRSRRIVWSIIPIAWLVILFQSLASTSTLRAEQHSMRLRVAWGGPARSWQGTLRVSEGSLTNLHLMGIEPDEHAAIWLDNNAVTVRTPTPRTYDAFDLTVVAPAEAKLIVDFSMTENPMVTTHLEIPLASLVEQTVTRDLGDSQNRLTVQRAPGDKLRLHLDRDSLVLEPGEVMQVELEPNLIGIPAGTRVRIQADTIDLRTNRTITSSEDVMTLGTDPTSAERLAIEAPAPLVEGVYELKVEASNKRLGLKQVIAERKLQFVIVSNEPVMSGSADAQPFASVAEVNPVEMPVAKRFNPLPSLAALRRGALGTGSADSWSHPLGEMIQLGPGGSEPNISWEAYTLPITRPGTPHVLEVEYPSDVAQSMGISVVEPIAPSSTSTVSIDSGLYIPDDAAESKPEIQLHRVVFWPRSRSPLVLMANRREGARAVYGKIRALAGPNHLPKAFPEDPPSGRMLAAYFDRPLFAENFSAAKGVDSTSGRSLDDWFTFYEGTSRLIEYLEYVGYNGAFVSAVAEGSAIYPSQVWRPTPRYDSGEFFTNGQDAVRKDVLELMLCMFDRQGLTLVPVVDFATPLVQLEQLKRSGGASAASIQWIGANGRPLNVPQDSGSASGPYYNTLNPIVQQAMLDVVREIIQRYSGHSSFGGLAIRLSSRGYAQLPGSGWGFDDETIERFERETGVTLEGVPATEARFAERARLLKGELREEWEQWRAESLSAFYRRMQTELAAARPATKLYLAPVGMLDDQQIQADLLPALLRKPSVDAALRRIGVLPQRLGQQSGIVLMRPQRLAPPRALASEAIDLQIKQAVGLDRAVKDSDAASSLLYHEPQPARLADFNEKSPFRGNHSMLVTVSSPSGNGNRQRFAHSLATLDSQCIADGGMLLPLGQEAALADFVATFRQLPAVPFHAVEGEVQPVTIRTCTYENETYAYLVNDSPWRAAITLQVSASTRLSARTLGVQQTPVPLEWVGTSSNWKMELEPYGLVGAVFSEPDVRFSKPSLTLEGDVTKQLTLRLKDLGERASALGRPMAFEAVQNPDFEQLPDAQGNFPGWSLTVPSVATLRADASQKHRGSHSAVLSGKGTPVGMISEPFDPPSTGRLTMLVWLRVADVANQPSLRLAIQGRLNGREYYRYASLGQGQQHGMRTEWGQYKFRVDDLPLQGLSDMRVRFDLMGAGTVWIDDVELSHLAFSQDEKKALQALIFTAYTSLQEGRLGDCNHMLEDYWLRFLLDNVSLTQQHVARDPRATTAAPPAKPAREKRSGVLEAVRQYFNTQRY